MCPYWTPNWAIVKSLSILWLGQESLLNGGWVFGNWDSPRVCHETPLSHWLDQIDGAMFFWLSSTHPSNPWKLLTWQQVSFHLLSLAVALVTQINLVSETYICYWVIWLPHLVFPLLRKSISRVWGRLTTRLPRRRWFYNLLRAASDQNIKVHLHNGMYGAVQ